MTIRFLVNFALLAIPIATTFGILFGIQTHRQATGQTPLFAPKPDNGITKERYCQKTYGITPKTKGLQYTLNPNQWGWNEGDPGKLCVNVTSFNNGTYTSSTTAPEFMVSWQYPPGNESFPVHGFPNIMVDDNNMFPATLSSLSKINVDVEWHYGIGNETTTASGLSDLTAERLNANVAIDMFIDSDKNVALDPSKAKYELMVWFAAIGPSTQPYGYNPANPITTHTVNGTTFDLFAGVNQKTKQNVLTWYSPTPVEKFTGDIASLINATFKVTTSAAQIPSTGDYMGYFALGTETFSSDKTVTFYVPHLSIDIETSTSSNT